mgnify:CR=1 FL=1
MWARFSTLGPIFLVVASHAATRPNIVFIFADDWGWGDLGCHGHPYVKTPNLDRLARTGMVFDAAYASAPNCAPTRACIMTGLWTPRHGVYTVEDSMGGRADARRFLAPPNTTELATEFRTIAESLQDAGYDTACIGKWHLGMTLPMVDGKKPDQSGEGDEITIGNEKGMVFETPGHTKGHISVHFPGGNAQQERGL